MTAYALSRIAGAYVVTQITGAGSEVRELASDLPLTTPLRELAQVVLVHAGYDPSMEQAERFAAAFLVDVMRSAYPTRTIRAEIVTEWMGVRGERAA